MNLVPRQRKILELITSKPEVAKYVRSFTWTLVWKDTWDDYHHETLLEDIDHQTWNVFARLTSVTHLDLASIHTIWEEPITRQNPSILFPKVTSLRLLGWMHRDLIKSILNSLDRPKLRSLSLDFLEDQGSHPSGYPMSADYAEEHSNPTEWQHLTHLPSDTIPDELLQRQETGRAAIFPGPSWYPMRLLTSPNAAPLSPLTHLHLTIPSLAPNVDLRNTYTLFHSTASLIRESSPTLKSLTIILDEAHTHYSTWEGTCGTSRLRYRGLYRPWYIRMTAIFLKILLEAIEESVFPDLEEMRFEGFHLLGYAAAKEELLGGVREMIESCRFGDVDFTGKKLVSGRMGWVGFDGCREGDFEEEALRDS